MSGNPTHRVIVERMGQAIADAIETELGQAVEMGLPADWQDELLDDRPFPLRVVAVQFERPLRDVVVMLASLNDDLLLRLAEAGTAALLDEIDASDVAWSVVEATEFDDRENAADELDALWREPLLRMQCAMGEVVAVFGQGLLESSDALLRGEPEVDEDAEAAAAGDDPSRYEFGEGGIGDGEAEEGYGAAAGTGTAGGSRYEFGDGALEDARIEGDDLVAVDAHARAGDADAGGSIGAIASGTPGMPGSGGDAAGAVGEAPGDGAASAAGVPVLDAE